LFQEAAGAYSFTPFILILAVYILYLQYALPETKGKTYKQIEEMFSDDEEHISQKYKSDADEISLLNST
jgi:cell division protein FtsL